MSIVPVVESVAGPVFYQGAYVQAAYRLTGEHRAYDRKLGTLGRLVPHDDFISFKDRGITGWGAWEVGVRYSVVDLTNPDKLNGHYYNSATNSFTTTSNAGNGTLQDVTLGMTWFLMRSRPGLVLRAVGESPESAHALGYPVRRIRLVAVVAGGALCGLAGAYISVIYTPLWVEGMVAGKGWIALALTTFATWRPARVLLGAYLFGGVTMLQFHLQGAGVEVPSEALSALPYVATIVVLALISRNPTWIRVNMPASLGRAFHPGS